MNTTMPTIGVTSGGGGQSVLGYLQAGFASTTVTCGFKPKKVMFSYYSSNSKQYGFIYDEDVSTTLVERHMDTAVSSIGFSSSDCMIASIDNDGFTVKSSVVNNSSGLPKGLFWVAIG